MDNDRDELVTWVRGALDGVSAGQYLLLEYLTGDDVPVEPYAQAAPDPGGWYCELASARYLPGHRSPLDEPTVTGDGWRHPDTGTGNWWQVDVPRESAAERLVDGLWFGRKLTDPDRYAISIRTFPCGRRYAAQPSKASNLITV